MLAQQIVNGLTIGSFYALMAIGLTIIFGLMDVINFAHGEFYMLSGFLTLLFASVFKINWFLSVAMAAAIVFFFGQMCEKLILKPLRDASLLNKALSMIGLSFFLKNLIIASVGARSHDVTFPQEGLSLRFGSVLVTYEQVWFMGMAFLVFILLYVLLYWTRRGKAMRATFQNKEAAALMGVDIHKMYSWTFGLGCLLAAVAGSLLGTLYMVYPAMGDIVIVKSFIVAIMGGMGSIPGAICGGFTLGVVESLAAGYISSEYKDVVGFLIVIVLLLVRPKGMFGK